MSQSKLMSFFSSATEKRKRDSDDSDESQPGPSTPKKTSRPRGFCDDWLVIKHSENTSGPVDSGRVDLGPT